MEEHEVDGPLTLHVIDGAFRFYVREESYDLKANALLTLDKELMHDVEATEDCAFLLTILYSERT